MILAMALFFSRGSAQDSDGQTNLVDRQPVVAGQFYAGDAGRLKADLSSLFANAEPKQLDNVVAIILRTPAMFFPARWLRLHLIKSILKRNMTTFLWWHPVTG